MKVRILARALMFVLMVAFSETALAAAPAKTKQDGSCEVSDYGVTGNKLPAVVKDAIKALPEKYQGIDIQRPTLEQVILIQDFDKWTKCVHMSDPKQIDWFRSSVRMFAWEAQLPIYVSAYRQDISEIIAAYPQQEFSFLRYIVAAWIGHEVWHAQFHERGETQPYAFEVFLMHDYRRTGKLPESCGVCTREIIKSEGLLSSATQAVQNGTASPIFIATQQK